MHLQQTPALSLLSSEEPRAPGSLGRRVMQITQVPLDEPSVRHTLEALSLCYDQYDDVAVKDGEVRGLAALAKHRDVRGDMQDCTMQLDVEFARSLGMVDHVFEQLEQSLDKVDQQCRGLRLLVDRALRSTASVAEMASVVDDERRELALRERLAEQFVHRFSPDHQLVDRLLQTPLIVDDSYFSALDAVETMRLECVKMLGVDGQMAVRELADELQQLEASSYDNLLRWLIDRVRELGRSSPDVDRWMRVALDKIRGHAALFDAVVAEISRARCEALGRDFIGALTKGGPGVAPRPIEAHAGDPQRYVGDMLAWVHQACASEKEFFDALGLRAESPRMLAVALTSVARPLEIRVVQTTNEMRTPVALYRVYSLLAFYRALFDMLCAKEAGSPEFMDTVESLTRGTRALLVDALERMADLVTGDFESVTTVLEVPVSLNSLLLELAEIVRLHADSLALTTTGDGQADDDSDVVDDVTSVLNKVLDEAQLPVDAASPSGGGGGGGGQLREYERALFELNVLATVRDAMADSANVLASWMPLLAERETAASSALCDHLVGILKERSYLPFDGDSDVQVADVQAFNGALKMATDLDVTRLVSRLENHLLARNVAQTVVRSFVEAYAKLHEKVCRDHSDDQALLSVLLPPETVSTLL
ncbi:Golgi transport complex subunit 6 [Coemansia sp. RSA 1286]|nr:Golgi transport complex subunit 6 [Coemansia sp. RSA 1286]